MVYSCWHQSPVRPTDCEASIVGLLGDVGITHGELTLRVRHVVHITIHIHNGHQLVRLPLSFPDCLGRVTQKINVLNDISGVVCIFSTVSTLKLYLGRVRVFLPVDLQQEVLREVGARKLMGAARIFREAAELVLSIFSTDAKNHRRGPEQHQQAGTGDKEGHVSWHNKIL